MKRTEMAGWCLTMVLAAGLAVAGEAPSSSRPKTVDFNRDIRPILSETCFQCHGPDKNKRKADLRLDLKEGVYEDLGGYAAVVPGKPDESELYRRVSSDDATEKMPPPKFAHPLTAAQVDLLKRWIEQGAEWKGHWAYIAPSRAPVPDVKQAGPIKSEIDRFIRAKLDELGLKPAPEADRVTLIRRLSLDLTGLPPEPEEVAAFVADTRPEAYERLVDRLLASPHYGERMAIYWLDLVRYADTVGYHSDVHRDVSLYRDYVINAFNNNKTFDRFKIEQLAGDLLPDATSETRVASGYNRMLMTTEEGGAQAKEYAAKYAADRVRNVSSVWLGTTLGCTECHDHKYDPFLTKEFYSFGAFFADLKETVVGRQEPTMMPAPEQASRLAEFDAKIAPLRSAVDTQTPALDTEQAAWERSLKERKVDWLVLRPVEAASKDGATLQILDDGSVLAKDKSPDNDTYTLTLKTAKNAFTAIKLEVLPDKSLPAKGPGRAGNGNFVLNEFEVSVGGSPVAWSNVSATHSQTGFDVAASADGKADTGWAILPKAGGPNHAVYEAKADLGAKDKDETTLVVTMKFNHGTQHTIGHFRLSATSSPRPVRAEGDSGLAKPINAILAVEPDKRTDAQKKELSAHFRTIAPALEPTRKALAALQSQRDGFVKTIPTTLVSVSMAPRTMRLLPRGNWLDDSGPIAEPETPRSLPPLGVSGRRATRLDLAEWLVRRDNPLVARVFVNRLWKIAFGQGLVASLDDFGAQGAWPSHPALLDWLALELIDRGWDVKAMLRLMVTSETYRQTSTADKALRQVDPYNRWLARQSRFRLDAEAVRDDALAVSGLLARKVGGPSAKPYQPAGYWAYMNFPKREYQADHGEGLYRRGLYTYWCRTFLHPSLLAFDASTREECAVQRPRSNTPLQALVLLNDPIYVEASRVLAERIVRQGGAGVEPRIQFAYQRALSRPARADEANVLAALYQRHHAQYQADKASAEALIHVGEWPVPADIDPVELASWTSVARVILNLHETITRN